MSAPIYFLCASPVGTVTAYTGLYLSIKLFTSQTINTNQSTDPGTHEEGSRGAMDVCVESRKWCLLV
jgi:hypothetical protein